MAAASLDPNEASNLTSGLTSVLACMIPVLAFAYIAGVFWTLDYRNRRRLPLDKAPPTSHRYAPIAYAFVVITSLVEVAISSWVLLQYSLQGNYPNSETRSGVRLVLFSACWTSVTAAAFTILFVHPKWTKHPICSVGSQSIWILLTWTFWLASALVLNHAIPRLFARDMCQQLIYCGHIRAIFAFSVLEFIVFTVGLATTAFLAWRLAREVWHPASVRSNQAA
ncbi:hypothetical protein R3P38DRAFT_1704094 [Favolaschia claudopus]|uniref:Uncharacterized protein n=1 Tax=Favolaschia claudopus TaxID=2862362 RepID=A0AAW0ABK8_9AGAR